jgi:ankyrin repeat protein
MDDGTTPLYIAINNDHLEAARLLLDKGAQVGKSIKDGSAVLYNASSRGQKEMVQLLLDKGARGPGRSGWIYLPAIAG